ncbi:MAG: Ig domain-containing protein [Paludibacteraceae bacterium]|nr:Ig domain-containing protein [Paludibacteraceae bacterium]
MKNLLKKSLILALGCMMASTNFALADTHASNGDYFYELSTATSANNIYTFTSNGLKAKSYDNIYVGVPSAQSAGTIGFKCTGNQTSRFIYIYRNAGTTKSEGIQMSSSYKTTNFTSSDIIIVNSKPYLRFSTTDDFKINNVQLTITGGTSTNIAVDGVSLDKTELKLEVGKSEQLTATVDPRGATNTKVTWTSSDTKVATVDENGNVTAVGVGIATITVTTDDGGFTATCKVEVTASTTPIVHVEGIAFAKSHTEITLYVNDTQQLQYSITPSDATNQAVTWSAADQTVVSVSNTGLVTALKKGDTKVTVTTVDGDKTAESIIHVKEKEVPVPSTDLTLHETEVYEDPKGYNTPLVEFNKRDYEVYYLGKGKVNGSSVAAASTGLGSDGKISSNYITEIKNSKTVAIDGWFAANPGSMDESTSTTQYNQFKGYGGDWKMSNNQTIEFSIKGYDMFSILAKDNNSTESKNQHFEVYIDNVLQKKNLSTSIGVRDYSISPTEHVIKIIALGGSNNYIYAFSLRLAYVPKVKHLSGNDSTQVVMQTQNLSQITYYLKNKVSDAEFSWEGAAATGISMQKATNDTLYVAGTANCKNGTYKYTISAKDEGGNVVSSIQGKFTVSSRVSFQRQIDTVKTVYEKSAIEPVKFIYYSIDKNDLSFQWTGATPAGLSFSVDEATHTITLSGTPTTVGTFPYIVSLKDANTLNGKVIVESNSPVIVPGASKTMLYLYKADKTSAVFTDMTRQYNYFARPAGGGGQTAADYSAYDFIVISEDADANNEEVINIINNVKKPVLNMKNFTYTRSRLGWGYPDNGSVNNTKITVLQSAHPIFKGLNAKDGSEINVLSSITDRGLMPVEVEYQGTYALASALKQGAQYDEDGEPETFIHEVPQSLRGAKYILFPLSQKSAGNLTSDGKKLLQNVIDYLLSNEEPQVTLPELRITSFSINGAQAQIDEAAQEIRLEMPKGTDLTALQPQITLADNKTKVTPESGATVNFSDNYFGVTFTVSDFINRKVYTAYITTATGLDETAIQGVWFDGRILRNPEGKWLYIYNVSGTLLTTTNSEFSFEALPHSIYIIRSETGTMKVFK